MKPESYSKKRSPHNLPQQKHIEKKFKPSKQDAPSTNFHTIQEFRVNLPIYSAKDRLKMEISENASLVVIGETGSGKTTQIPQFVYESNPNEGVAVTQPRRIAAIRFVVQFIWRNLVLIP
jgi:HrpA-like RNA helicase